MADVVLLATADWDHPLWTNKQHVAVALAAVRGVVRVAHDDHIQVDEEHRSEEDCGGEIASSEVMISWRASLNLVPGHHN